MNSQDPHQNPPTTLLDAARWALRPLVTDAAALELLVPAVAQLLTETDDGRVVLLDGDGRERFGRHGYALDARAAVCEFREASRRAPDGWMIAQLFRKDNRR